MILGREIGRLVGWAGCVVLCAGIISSGCADPEPPGVSASAGDTVVELDSGGATAGADGSVGEIVVPPPSEVTDDPGGGELEGGIGEPCESNDDCEGGWCVLGKNGHVCTIPCIETCPTGWVCKQIPIAGSDLQFACAELHVSLCRPCMEAASCVTPQNPLAVCRSLGAEGSFCATSCAAGQCPAGYACEVDAGSGQEVCVPDNGACECDGVAKAQGLETTCSRVNEYGACAGVRACGADGLSACSASAARAELCNGEDDDCDGVVDEDQADLDQDGLADCVDPDKDGDTFGEGPDCDDLDVTVHPEATEKCNGKDDDCNGTVDDFGTPGCTTYYLDADGDGYGLETDSVCACGPTGDYSAKVGGDCDDSEKAMNPGAKEICDGLDNDCDGEGDTAGLAGCVPWYVDDDQDGHGHPAKWKCLCGPMDGYLTLVGDDCDDTSELTWPGAPELCDLQDNDCDGRIDIAASAPPDCPADCAGKTACVNKCAVVVDCSTDCGPGEAACLAGELADCSAPATVTCLDPKLGCAEYETCGSCPPMPTETCNGQDDNCNAEVDEGVKVTVFVDADTDGYGKAGTGYLGCEGAEMTSLTDDDCNDSDKSVHPGAAEICDGKDQDCDSAIDDGVTTVFWVDQDGDGYGDPAKPVSACEAPSGTSEESGDCAPTDGNVYPGAPELCNGADDSCDGKVDEAWPELGSACDGADADPCPDGVVVCAPSLNDVLCEDADDVLVEKCNGVDDNCDGSVDELWPDLGQPCDGDDDDSCAEGTIACDAAGTGVTCAELGNGHVESCNGQDDDCDKLADELWPELGTPCDGPDADKCATGTTVCAASGAAAVCEESGVAKVESCNGQDDDCDGTADEDWPTLQTPCDGPDSDKCALGTTVCNPAGTGVLCEESGPAKVELCNGQDDDCDGAVDEDFPTKGQPCDGDDADSCADGQLACDGVKLSCNDDSSALVEVCNNKDDDCDGTVDGIVKDCSNSCGSGTQSCNNGNWSSCSAPTPECTSGPCCDGCYFRSSNTQCGGPIQTTQSCQGSCGGSVVQNAQYKYCTGYSASCGTGNTKWESQGVVDYCSGGQLCKTSGSSASCVSCSCGCSGGQCTSNSQYAKQCVSGDVWWTDCNGSATSKVEDCGGCSCQSGSCKVTTTSNKVCSGSNVYTTDCKGNLANFVESCCGGCSNGKCQSSGTVTIDQSASTFTKGGSTYWWSVYTHPDASADGWFNTYAYGPSEKFVYTFGGGTGSYYGIFKTNKALSGSYKVWVHRPNPDAFDPSLGGPGPNSYVKCTSVKFRVKHKGNTGGQTITKSMSGSGWLLLGTFQFCNQYGEVRYDDAASPSDCAVSFDAVRWEAQ